MTDIRHLSSFLPTLYRMCERAIPIPDSERRKFLRNLALATLALSAPAVLFNSCSSPDYKSLPEGQLLKICGTDVVNSIGKKWITLHPEEKNLTRIQSILLAGSRWKQYEAARVKELATYLHGRSQVDFSQSRTVVSYGWVLSETDCRIAALHYLNSLQKS